MVIITGNMYLIGIMRIIIMFWFRRKRRIEVRVKMSIVILIINLGS